MTTKTEQAVTYLLVEDNDAHAAIVERCFQLAKLPHHVRRVKSGEGCLAYLAAEEPFADRSRYPYPDAVLLDIRMPGTLDGMQTLEAIRSDPRHRRLSVTMLTGSLQDIDVHRCAALGISGYVVKSDHPGQMLESLRAIHGGFGCRTC